MVRMALPSAWSENRKPSTRSCSPILLSLCLTFHCGRPTTSYFLPRQVVVANLPPEKAACRKPFILAARPIILYLWSGRRDSNSRQPAWKAGTLPTELLPQNHIYFSLKNWLCKGDAFPHKISIASPILTFSRALTQIYHPALKEDIFFAFFSASVYHFLPPFLRHQL